MIPAETTIDLSKTGLFLSKFSSSIGISLSGSLSGKPTNPPRGKALREYSTFLKSNLARIGPNPIANLLTWMPWRVAARKWPDSWTTMIAVRTAVASRTDSKLPKSIPGTAFGLKPIRSPCGHLLLPKDTLFWFGKGERLGKRWDFERWVLDRGGRWLKVERK
ncbi:hypothetical protein N665_1398s0006 [Sinapis alba]|nr:hypothetical protein N665_1398s0006 [Sinapis alba]